MLFGALSSLMFCSLAFSQQKAEDQSKAAAQIIPPQKQPPLSPEQQFRLAKNEFIHGDYEKAINHLTSLIYPIRLSTEADLVEARRFLGIAYYLTEQYQKADEEFTKLLYLRPQYQLDPFYVAPPIIEYFEKIRERLKPQLDALIAVRKEREAEQVQKQAKSDNSRLVVQKERYNYYYRNIWLNWLPFGVGQYQNGDNALGHLFAVGQGASIVTALVSGTIFQLKRQTYNNGKLPIAEGRPLQLTNNISLGVFAALWLGSALQAWINYEPVSMQQVSPKTVDKNDAE